MELKTSYKKIGNANPVMTQRFGADPYALVYDGRVYLYMTGDNFIYDEQGNVKENNYSNIYTLNVISSADLVNWTDHGSVYAASDKGAASWGTNSWAPAAVCKEIDGKMKFFLYFANGGNGIAVLTSDSPTGPFTDPINKALISREETPACADVTWLFDPAVLVDDDGEAYIYFGGGIPSPDKASNPGTARVAKLGADMISLDGEPRVIENVPYLYEDAGINKINGKYIYSYCSNFSVPDEEAAKLGFGCGEIITMESDNPMGPFKIRGSILKNPEYFFGIGGNNHHCMFEYKNEWYMSYHSSILEREMGVKKGYRSTNIDRVTIDADGKIEPITGTQKGVYQMACLNPYNKTDASTIAVMAGVDTREYEVGKTLVTGMSDGSWLGVYGVDFGKNAPKEFQAEVRSTKNMEIKVCADAPDGEVIAEVKQDCDDMTQFTVVKTAVTKNINGKHDIYFVFSGEGYEFKSWMFS